MTSLAYAEGGTVSRRDALTTLGDAVTEAIEAESELTAAESFDDRRQRLARERNAQTWRELHPDGASA